jgi:farnesyl diphosphate synthase
MSLADEIRSCAADTEALLRDCLGPGAPGVPPRLLEAMRHGTLGGGKRLRPYLLRASAELFGVPAAASVQAGAAVECVHCYSLIHDDLPDMDNDRLRRGRPSVWAAFDPATAILAGDALLSLAFGLLADIDTHRDPGVRVALAAELARASGPAGMAGGQAEDLAAEETPLGEAGVISMQRKKTGALIVASVSMGAILGRAGEDERRELRSYARAAGLAFQLADDILDATESSETIGKTAGKDGKKSTLVGLLGVDGARSRCSELAEEAVAALEGFGAKAERLRELAQHMVERRN